MFLQELQSGLSFVMQAYQAQAGFATTMLSMADEDSGADAMMSMIPGARGQTGERGASVPGLDGQDGDDMALLGWPNPVHSSFGEMTMTANGTGTVATLQNTYYQQTAGWIVGELDDFTFDGTATLTAQRGGNYQTMCAFSGSSSGANQVYRFAIFKSGVLITEHLVRLKFNASSDVGGGTICGIISGVVVGDTFDLRIYNETSAGQTFTMSDANFNVTRV